MMTRQVCSLIVLLILTLIHTGVLGQSISIKEISPNSPARLGHDQEVKINFDYSTRHSRGVRIFIRPVTSGNLSPNYAASGSPVYPRGDGSGSANFTITKGNVTVDQLRVQMVASNQQRVLFEFFIPVQYTFGSSAYKLANPELIKNYSKIFDKKTITGIQQPSAAEAQEDTTDEEEVKRVIKEDGTIEIHQSDGTIIGYQPSGGRYMLIPRVNPETGDTVYAHVAAIQVQENDQPASPPGFVAETDSDVNMEWLQSLNSWIEQLGNRLLTRIEALLDEQNSFQNYKDFEKKNSDTIYEQVNMRYTFLEKLLQYGS